MPGRLSWAENEVQGLNKFVLYICDWRISVFDKRVICIVRIACGFCAVAMGVMVFYMRVVCDFGRALPFCSFRKSRKFSRRLLFPARPWCKVRCTFILNAPLVAVDIYILPSYIVWKVLVAFARPLLRFCTLSSDEAFVARVALDTAPLKAVVLAPKIRSDRLVMRLGMTLVTFFLSFDIDFSLMFVVALTKANTASLLFLHRVFSWLCAIVLVRWLEILVCNRTI